MVPAYGQFLYATNANSASISGYAMNVATGALVPVPGSPFSTPSSPQHTAIDPGGRFLYVNKPNLGNIAVFAISPANGSLTEIPGSPFQAQPMVGLAIEPAGRFLYVENPGTDNLSGFVINQVTGALGPVIPGAPFATGSFPYDTMAVHPNGHFLYQTNAALYVGQPSVAGFSIDQPTGSLTPVPGSPIPVNDPANNIAVDPTGRFVFAAAGGNIYGFNIDAGTGSLSSISGSPFPASASNAGIATDRQGRFVFLASGGTTVNSFRIDQTSGSLVPAPGSPYTVGVYPSGMAVDPTNNFLYVALTDSIAVLRINQTTGALSMIPGSPFPAESGTGYLMIAVPGPPLGTLYLHGSGGPANPASLFLDQIASVGATAKYEDSPGITFSGGNQWKEVGLWSADPANSPGMLSALGPLHSWVGLRNSDDQGTRFDLRVEVYKNSSLIVSGETHCIQGATRDANKALAITTDFGSFAPTQFNGTSDQLSVRVLTRIGTNGVGGFCGGHSSAAGLRLYFDSTSVASRLDAGM
jgi:6-phosphogluconolactonase (cycloisomerase 2 family)